MQVQGVMSLAESLKRFPKCVRRFQIKKRVKTRTKAVYIFHITRKPF